MPTCLSNANVVFDPGSLPFACSAFRTTLGCPNPSWGGGHTDVSHPRGRDAPWVSLPQAQGLSLQQAGALSPAPTGSPKWELLPSSHISSFPRAEGSWVSTMGKAQGHCLQHIPPYPAKHTRAHPRAAAGHFMHCLRSWPLMSQAWAFQASSKVRFEAMLMENRVQTCSLHTSMLWKSHGSFVCCFQPHISSCLAAGSELAVKPLLLLTFTERLKLWNTAALLCGSYRW